MINNIVQIWCQLNKDIELNIYYDFGDFFGDKVIKLEKGTYLQTTKEDACIYDGEGFWYFNREDLDEVNIVPWCEYSSKKGIPESNKKEYPNTFNGNPEDWFTNKQIFQD